MITATFYLIRNRADCEKLRREILERGAAVVECLDYNQRTQEARVRIELCPHIFESQFKVDFPDKWHARWE